MQKPIKDHNNWKNKTNNKKTTLQFKNQNKIPKNQKVCKKDFLNRGSLFNRSLIQLNV